jgi:hypothetical protein
MRVLVTGSRGWADRYTIMGHIDRLIFESDDLLVIHGDAPGADRIARDVARVRRSQGSPVAEQAFPAKWDECGHDCPPGHRKWRRDGAKYCPTAGHRRNGEMVALGPDLCLAFVMPCDDERCRKPRPHWSHGADDCANRAEAAGVATVRVGPDGQEVGR